LSCPNRYELAVDQGRAQRYLAKLGGRDPLSGCR
jgi:hypothetical protein